MKFLHINTVYISCQPNTQQSLASVLNVLQYGAWVGVGLGVTSHTETMDECLNIDSGSGRDIYFTLTLGQG